MSYNEHFQSKLALLNQYALCLEKENKSKNNQIQTLHHHLQAISRENQTLRQHLHEAHLKMNQKKQPHQDMSLQTSFCFEPAPSKKPTEQSGVQTEETQQQDRYEYEDEIKKLKEIITYKEQKLRKYQIECEEMYEAIQKLEKDLAEQQSKVKKYNEKIAVLEDSLKNEEQKRIAAQAYVQSIASSVQSTDQNNNQLAEQYYEMKISFEQLILENNTLIERTRELEKQKNDYYHQLKAYMRMGSTNQHLGKSSMRKDTKIKDQRWRQIEANLQKLQLQNQAMQSNLMIRR